MALLSFVDDQCCFGKPCLLKKQFHKTLWTRKASCTLRRVDKVKLFYYCCGCGCIPSGSRPLVSVVVSQLDTWKSSHKCTEDRNQSNNRLERNTLLEKWKATLKRIVFAIVLCLSVAPFQTTMTYAAPLRQSRSFIHTRNTHAKNNTPFSVWSWRYSQLLKAVKQGQVLRVIFSADQSQLIAITKDGGRYKLRALPPHSSNLIAYLSKHKVDIVILPKYKESGLVYFLKGLLFPIPFVLLLYFLQKSLLGGSLAPFDLQKANARVSLRMLVGVTFQDVAGYDSVKVELQEVVEFVRNPEIFSQVGAKVPRGVILEGPPGTGKTLLARAVAGEAGVAFFSIAGSEFVEMFVGVGASRVRDLFAQAKKNAPCIIFIDEIDAVGRQRGAGVAGGNDEREQTLNQLLTEMDGFDENKGIIVLAATNRSDVLDRALLRAGRFDRRIMIEFPDMNTRTAILKVHARGKALDSFIHLEKIARRTPGFSGASLQNLMNEAAILAARREHQLIMEEDLEDALDRILLGPEKKQFTFNDYYKRLVSYHEAGHALVGALSPNYDQVLKISIIPRGSAGGLTFFSPIDESRIETGLYSRQYLESQLAVGLGGRIAEEIVFGEDQVTTGAANDFQHVTNIARQMVTKFGMSSVLGPMFVDQSSNSHPFLGREFALRNNVYLSGETKLWIDQEVTRLVEQAYQRARNVLESNRHVLDKLANMLIEKETVSSEELQMLLSENDVFLMDYEELVQDQKEISNNCSSNIWQKYDFTQSILENGNIHSKIENVN
ncbi:AAA-type ATPase [Galdieria sulphuraria]|uniref:AAA-type ATPase n=1 Tax=Galdieria sulphuraria TaxID=130081 RepID=M2W728_GALSU|nr:AAA-type ATPase [Galdieria sulphuraria]EME31616.1 AAA-type ATPase [Galdieria sulphuraria]|eukprot:XP_005708136.1 AAA-type ATPase [Galdieria sulphuraria]